MFFVDTIYIGRGLFTVIYSVCIKSNNNNIIQYLQENFEILNIEEVYLSKHSFKNYDNVILHHTSNFSCTFYNSISDILSNCVLKFYENKLVKNIIHNNYFYFTDIEKKKIYDYCIESLYNSDDIEVITRKDILFCQFLKYITENKKLTLDGFISFRLQSYFEILDNIVESCVNRFLVEREYNEFIELLKIYINTQDSTVEKLHLIYANQESILLDENNNIIDANRSAFNAKYLSDISFSSNDYALNTLLTLLPNKIYLHLVDEEDEFINTLKLIFNQRIYLCTDCQICNAYRMIPQKKK